MNRKHLTQGRANWTWILLAIFATPVTLKQYEIQPLRNNLGLFYAKVEPLRITSTHWRIVVYMDPQNLQAHLQFKSQENQKHLRRIKQYVSRNKARYTRIRKPTPEYAG